jgi:hypothetical protein
MPPAKIATPTFGSDVAARRIRATLRAAVFQAPDVTLKMSTALEALLPAAQGMRLAHAISKQTSAHSIVQYPNPRNTLTTRNDANMATRTIATSEDRDSEIRQRCGCKPLSSYAENCSGPGSQRVGCCGLLSRVCCGHTAGEQHGSGSRSGGMMSLPPLHALGCRARF